MPIVPRAQRQVETRPLPGPGISPAAPAEAFASRPRLPDLSGVQKFVDQEREKAAQVALLDADNKLADRQVELHRQALERRGKDAMGATADAREQWDQAASEIGADITDERVQRAFEQRASSRWSSLHEAIESHAASEGQKYDTEQATAALTNRYNDAVTNYRDPAKVGTALSESEAILRDFGKRNGLPPETVEQKVAAARSAVHVGIVDRMLSNGQDQDATKYFNEHKGEIAGEKIADVEKALELGSTLGKGMRNADGILYGPKPVSSRKEAYERARAIEDPKERQATEQRLDLEFARRDRDERDRYEQLLGTAQDYVARGLEPPPGIMSGLKLGAQAQIRAAHRRIVKGEKVSTDPSTMYQLMQQAGSPDPKEREKFARLDLVEYLDKLSTSDFEKLAKEQINIRQGKPVSPELKTLVSGNQMLNQAIKATRLKPGSPEYLELQTKVGDAQLQELESSGRKTLTPEQQQKIIDKVVTSHFYLDRPGPDPAYRGAELGRLDADQRGRLYVPIADIPKTELAAMKKAAAGLGNPNVAERDLERAWAATLMGDGAMLARALRGAQ